MKRKMVCTLAALAALAAFADPNDPQITQINPVPSQDNARVLTVNYHLDEQAIVTFDVKTNGVSIGAANLKFASGDVHKVVAAGDRQLRWNAWKAWPGYKFTTPSDPTVTVEVKAWATNSPPDYMTVKLVGNSKDRPGELGEKRFYTGPEQLPDLGYGGVVEKGGVTNNAYKTDYLVMRRIPAAGQVFRMGYVPGENGADSDREIPHFVSLTNDFYMGVFELTAGQFRNITTNFPQFAGLVQAYNATRICAAVEPLTEVPMRPVDCYRYDYFRGENAWPENGHDLGSASTLSFMRDALCLPLLDFPTEAEWEFACRAGTTTARYDGSEYNPTNDSAFAELGYFGVADNNWATSPQNVGLLKPNGYGLYDMYGNVCEWCLDWYTNKNDYAEWGSYVIAPVGPATDDNNLKKVARGGNANSNGGTSNGRSAYRYDLDVTYSDDTVWAIRRGFRLVCTF